MPCLGCLARVSRIASLCRKWGQFCPSKLHVSINTLFFGKNSRFNLISTQAEGWGIHARSIREDETEDSNIHRHDRGEMLREFFTVGKKKMNDKATSGSGSRGGERGTFPLLPRSAVDDFAGLEQRTHSVEAGVVLSVTRPCGRRRRRCWLRRKARAVGMRAQRVL